MAEVSRSRGGEYNWVITCEHADCRHRIDLEFFLGQPRRGGVVMAKDRPSHKRALQKISRGLVERGASSSRIEREGKRGRTRRV